MIHRFILTAIFVSLVAWQTVASGIYYFHDNDGWYLHGVEVDTHELTYIQTKSTEMSFRIVRFANVSTATAFFAKHCNFLLPNLTVSTVYTVKISSADTVSMMMNGEAEEEHSCVGITALGFQLVVTGLENVFMKLIMTRKIPIDTPKEADLHAYEPLTDISSQAEFAADVSFITACCALGIMALVGVGLLLFYWIRYFRKRFRSQKDKTSPPKEEKTGEMVVPPSAATPEEKTCTGRSFELASPRTSPHQIPQKAPPSNRSQKLKQQLEMLNATTPKNSFDELRSRFPCEIEYLAALAGDGPRVSQSGSLDRTDLIDDIPL